MSSLGRRWGFSLLETVLTIGIIGTLSTVALSQVNPAQMLGSSRNATRYVAVNDLLGAITAFTIDNDGRTPPNITLPPIAGPTDFSGSYTIASSFDYIKGISVADFDNDGDDDIVGVSSKWGGEGLVWWERTGGEAPEFTWTKHTIDGNFKGYDVQAGDMDGDGLNDVVGMLFTGDIMWWRNEGGTPPTFSADVEIENTSGIPTAISLADIDGENGLDVLAAWWLFDVVRWFENDGTPLGANWSNTDVEGIFLWGMNEVKAVDIDEDGDMDIVGGEHSRWSGPAYVSLWENDGTPSGDNWDNYLIDNGEYGQRSVAMGDIDGDSDIDIASISYSGKVEWYENDGTPMGAYWTHNTIATNFGGGDLHLADLDLDNDLDLIAATEGGDKIAYWENEGAGSFADTYVFASGSEVNGVIDIAVLDMDGDTDLDIVAANSVADTIGWWRNTSIGGVSEPAPSGGISGEYKPICRDGIAVAECDAYGGVALDVLVPGYIASIPVDPMQGNDAGEEVALTGYEVRYDEGTTKMYLRAALAELEQEISIAGSIGTENCLVWDILNEERTCVLFE